MSAIDVLQDPNAKLTDVLGAIGALEAAEPERPRYRIGLSSNITVDLLAKHLRKHALVHGAIAEVHQGGLSAHLDNVRTFAELGVEHLVVLDLFDALLPSLESRVGELGPEGIALQAGRLGDELRLVLAEAAKAEFRWIDVALMHPLASAPRAVQEAIDACNAAIRDAVDGVPGARVFDTPDAVAEVGLARAFDPRYHLRFRAPYTAAACDELARRLVLGSRAGGQWLYKALVLDADGTLWGGIVGEDGLDGIKLDPHTYPGNAYWTAQHAYAELQRRGVLLCLASKNNPADVEEVLRDHPAMVLGDEQLVLKKVSWDDKATSLRAIAAELNIGLDSIVFVDDSPFEAEGIREMLPEVTVFDVPRDPFAYPALVRRIGELFADGTAGAGKTEQYRLRALAAAERAHHATEEEYLRSLQLVVDIAVDERASLKRISELTQKSNQFNLTTRRYGEAEIAAIMDDPDAAVLSLRVRDRFGDHGLVGVLVLRYGRPAAEVEAYLMSCRVLGRGVEHSVWEAVVALAAEHGATELRAAFLPTAKNAQVAQFYDGLGLERASETPEGVTYLSRLADLSLEPPEHIETNVHH